MNSIHSSNIDFIENDYDSLSYFEEGSDKEKESTYFQDINSDSPNNVIEKSKDGNYGKVLLTN